MCGALLKEPSELSDEELYTEIKQMKGMKTFGLAYAIAMIVVFILFFIGMLYLISLGGEGESIYSAFIVFSIMMIFGFVMRWLADARLTKLEAYDYATQKKHERAQAYQPSPPPPVAVQPPPHQYPQQAQAETIFCPYCGVDNPSEFNYCGNCKRQLPPR